MSRATATVAARPWPVAPCRLQDGVGHFVRLGVEPAHEVVQLTLSGRFALRYGEAAPSQVEHIHFVRVVAILVAKVNDVRDALKPKAEVGRAGQHRANLQLRRNLTRAKRVATKDRS